MPKKLIRDPQLDELVRELNQSMTPQNVAAEMAPEAAAAQPPATVPEDSDLEPLLLDMAQRGASDLLLVAGSPAIFRVNGVLTKAGGAAISNDTLHGVFAGVVVGALRNRLNDEGSIDFSLRLSPGTSDEDRRALRFRVNVHRQRGTLAAAIRALPTEIPTLATLNLPAQLAEVVKPTRGLVLVCGPTGSGKSTTLAALIGEINRNEGRHIITIEDPIEYEHRNAKSLIEQIEIGRDAPTFSGALRSALRQDPDVIFVGEMRDLDTVSTALTAAETGHLILSTLHTSDVAGAIHRIVDVFPADQQTQVRNQLALALNAVIVQNLIPRSGGQGRAVAVEVMLANQAVRNHIRTAKIQNLASEITLGKRAGMISLEESLAGLVRQGFITIEDARARSSRPDELESLMRVSKP